MKSSIPAHSLVVIIVTASLCLVGSSTNAQQKVQFTQYMFNPYVINPAYAGGDEALSLTFIHRAQWAGVEKAPSTQTLSGHTLFKQKQMGIGAIIVNDRIGVHKNLNASLSYAYHLKVASRAHLSMGLQAGIFNRKSDYASLPGASSDPRLSHLSISHTIFDFGFGLLLRTPRWHIGLSAPGLVPEKIDVNDSVTLKLRNLNYFMLAKYRMELNENVGMEPGLLLKYYAGLPLSYDVNMNFIFFNVLTTGLSYRKSESLAFLLKGQLTPQLQFGYSYDYPLGVISRISNGSHELMVNYVFKYKEARVSAPR